MGDMADYYLDLAFDDADADEWYPQEDGDSYAPNDDFHKDRRRAHTKTCGTCAEWGEGGEASKGLKYCGRNLGNAFRADESCSRWTERWTDGECIPKDGAQ